ncbi:hypothetical protein AB9P05_17775 [Roseivirga sp. BDSF3-8]|uniref:hypothetical protein n=1 Tax=Roseivirga sp. BDSF3-8 TaxID=3241598 RepID=UPI0035325115
MKIIRSWREIKVMMKYHFPVLTENDFIIENDDREGMLTNLAMKLRKSRPDLDRVMADLQRF